jgi:hypothetical protein
MSFGYPFLSFLIKKQIEQEKAINNNTFFIATIDKVFYYVSFVLTTCFGPYIKPSSGELTNY